MPESDRYNLRVGDKVRDRTTREEGRVVNIAPLAGDVLLVTVALFVGNAIRRKVNFQMRLGQVGGIPVEKIDEKLFQAAERAAVDVLDGVIKHPRVGGNVSQVAKAKALRNEAVLREESLAVRALKWVEANQDLLQGSPTLSGPSRALGTMRSRELLAEHERQHARRAFIQGGPAGPSLSKSQFRAVEERLEGLQKKHLKIREKIWNRHGKSLEAAYSDWLGGPGVNQSILRTRSASERNLRLQGLPSSPIDQIGTTFDRNFLGQQAEKEFRRLQRLQGRRERALNRKKGFDTLLDYLTRRSEQTPEGKWVGGYLNDILLNQGSPLAPSVIERHNRIANLLSAAKFEFTPLERREFEQAYGSILGGFAGQVQSALDVFRVGVNEISTTANWSERAGLWNERYAPLLQHLVERYHPRYARDLAAIQMTGRVGNLANASRERLQFITSELGFESAHAQALANIDFQNPARFEAELERYITNPSDWLRGHGGDPVALDVAELARGPRRVRGLNLPGERGWASNEFGPFNTFFSRADRVGSRVRGRTARPLQGKVAYYGGVPHSIDYVSGPGRFETQGLTLRPLGEEQSLLTGNRLFDPEAVLNLIQSLEGEATSAVPAEVTRKATLGLRGGLRGLGEEIQEVPTELLYHYLTGTKLSRVQATQFSGDLQKLGFMSLGEFETAQMLARTKAGAIYGRVPRGQLEGLLRGQEMSDLTSQFRSLLFTDLGQLPHGMHIDELRETARTNIWNKVISQSRSASQAQNAVVSLEDIVRWTKGGEAQLTEAARVLDPTSQDVLLGLVNQPASLVDPFMARVSRAKEAFTAANVSLNRLVRLPGETLREYNLRVTQEETLLYEQAVTGAFGNLFGRTAERVGGRVRGGVERSGLPNLQEAVSTLRAFNPRTDDIYGLSERLGISLVGYDDDVANKLDRFRELARIGRTKRTRGLAQAKAAELEQRIVQEFQLGRAMTALQQNVGVKNLIRLDPRSPEGPQFYNTIIEMLESGRITEEQLGGLNLPFQTVPLAGGKFGISGFDPNGPGGRYIYRPFTQGGANAGYAYLESDPSRVLRFGITDATTLYGDEISSLMGRRQLTLASRRQSDRLLGNMLLPAAQDITPNLPVFNVPGMGPLGFSSSVTTFENVASTTQRLIHEGQNFISLDIETDPFTRRLLNVSAAKYDIQGNLLDRGVDLATPEFWNTHEFIASNAERLAERRAGRVGRIQRALEAGEEVSPSLRTIIRNGQRVQIGQVVASEQHMVRQAVAWLQTNTEAVVGHNISFDIGELLLAAERNGMAAEAEILRGIAGGRLVDTLLASQVVMPNAASLSLEEISRNFLGKVADARGNLFREAHVASADAALAAELMGRLAREHGGAIGTALGTASQVGVTPGSILWDAIKGRAYEFGGTINPNTAREIFQQQTGGLLSIGGGMSVRPIDFLTGQAATNPEVLFAHTPHGFAREFLTRYQVVSPDDAIRLMEEKATDLARRRVRRITSGEGDAFRNLLLERERFQLAQARAAGEETYTRALDDLARRQAGAQTDFEARMLGNVRNYANENFTDTRLVRQLTLQEEFWGKEMAQHQAVVQHITDWLRQEGGQSRSMTQANQVWSAYMQRVQNIAPWSRLGDAIIAPEQRKLAFNIGALGQNPRAIRLTDPLTIGRDIDALTASVLSKLPEGELKEALGGVEANTLKALLSNRGKILGTEFGEAARSFVWERHLQPALAGGSTVTMEGMRRGSFQLQATGREAAIQELFSRGTEFAQSAANNVPNELAARSVAADALAAIQGEFLGTSVHGMAASLSTPSALGDVILRSRHGTPFDFQGRSLKDLLGAAMTQGEEEAFGVFDRRRRSILDTVKRAARKFTGEEINAAQKAIKSVNPDLMGTIFPWTVSTPEAVIGNATGFTPGKVTSMGLEAAGWAEQKAEQFASWSEANPASFGRAKAGLAVGAVALATVAGISILRRQAPPPSRPHSDPERETELNTSEQTHRVRVRIEGVDPSGVDHDQLTQSVQGVVGNFMGSDVNHSPTVMDQRTKVDRSALDRIASKLLS